MRARCGLFFLLLVCGCATKAGPAQRSDPFEPDPRADALTEPEDEAEVLVPSGNSESPSGGPVNEETVRLRWNGVPGFLYSLDVQRSEGEWLAGCQDASVLKALTSTTYRGTCPSRAERVASSDVRAFRLRYSNNGDWSEYVERAFASGETEVSFELPTAPPARTTVRWNAKSATAEYSLDVALADGTTIAPCVGAHRLLRTTSYVFDGACVTPSTTVNIGDVREFRICWAENADWAGAQCAGKPYNGLATNVAIAN